MANEITLTGKDGGTYTVPPESLDKALAAGYTVAPNVMFNKQTGLPEVVEDKAAALANPNVYSEYGDKEIKLVGKDGGLYSIPPTSLPQALKAGYRPQTPDEAKFQENVETQKSQGQLQSILEAINPGLKIEKKILNWKDIKGPDLGAPGMFAEKALNQLQFGVPETMDQYSQTPVQKEAQRQLEEEHPIAKTAGNVTGFLGGAALTGGIGDLAEGALAGTKLGPIASKAIAGAATGAAYSAPQTAVELGYGDKETAAETMLWGIGIGGGIGAGAGVIGAGGKALKGAASDIVETMQKPGGVLSPEYLSNKADELDATRLGITSAKANKLRATKGNDRLAEVVDTFNKEGLKPGIESAEKMADDAGEKLGQHFDRLDKALVDNTDIVRPLASDISNQIQKTLYDKYGNELNTNAYKAAKTSIDGLLEDIKTMGGEEPLTMSKMQEIKQFLGKVTKWDYNEDPLVNTAKKDLYHGFMDEQVNFADNIYKTITGEDKQLADYLVQKKRYGVALDLIDYGEKKYTAGEFGKIMPDFGTFKTGVHTMIGGGLLHGTLGGYAYPITWAADKLLGRFIENAKLTYGAKYLRQIAASAETRPLLGTFMARNATQSFSQRLSEFSSMVSGATYKAIPEVSPFKHVLGSDGATGLSKQQQYSKVAALVSQAATDPNYMHSQVSEITNMFGSDPALATLIAQKNQTAIQYLYSHLPKNNQPILPFQKQAEFTPTAAQMKDFSDRLEIINNPMAAVNHIRMGTLSPAHVETLKTVYPKIYSQMQGEVAKLAFDPKSPNLSYGVRLGLAQFSGMKDPNPVNYQTAYMMPQQGPQQQGQAPKTHKHAKLDKIPSLSTNADRVGYGNKHK